MKIQDEIKKMALSANACGKVMEGWDDDASLNELVSVFKEQDAFCITENVPGIDFIRKNIPTEILHAHNIYIDECVDLTDAEDKIILLGNCYGEVLVHIFGVSDVVVSGDCSVKVLLGRNAIAHVNVFENGEVDVDSSADGSKAYVHLYSDNAMADGEGDVRIRRGYLKKVNH